MRKTCFIHVRSPGTRPFAQLDGTGKYQPVIDRSREWTAANDPPSMKGMNLGLRGGIVSVTVRRSANPPVSFIPSTECDPTRAVHHLLPLHHHPLLYAQAPTFPLQLSHSAHLFLCRVDALPQRGRSPVDNLAHGAPQGIAGPLNDRGDTQRVMG